MHLHNVLQFYIMHIIQRYSVIILHCYNALIGYTLPSYRPHELHSQRNCWLLFLRSNIHYTQLCRYGPWLHVVLQYVVLCTRTHIFSVYYTRLAVYWINPQAPPHMKQHNAQLYYLKKPILPPRVGILSESLYLYLQRQLPYVYCGCGCICVCICICICICICKDISELYPPPRVGILSESWRKDSPGLDLPPMRWQLQTFIC